MSQICNKKSQGHVKVKGQICHFFVSSKYAIKKFCALREAVGRGARREAVGRGARREALGRGALFLSFFCMSQICNKKILRP